jgi:hypothetical protein
MQNPHIVLYHFTKWQELFIETVFSPKFDVIKWWGRFEYQAIGPIHLYAFSWNSGTPRYLPIANTTTDISGYLVPNQPLIVF